MSAHPTNPEGSPRLYHVGTLVYTTSALLTVLFWMLLGDFCIQIMEQLPTSLVPLQLRWASASDAMIGFITGSLPAVLGIILNPIVGLQSDGHRGPMGRRRPFLLMSTPVVVIALLGLGYATPVAETVAHLTGATSVDAVKIGWIASCMLVFVVARTYMFQVYQFLFVDVIPAEVMGKFIGCYRAVGALGAFVFHSYLFGKSETHTALIYVLSATLYGISFLLLIWKVREGDYPPPPPKKTLVQTMGGYFSECFKDPFYLMVYSLCFFFWSAINPLWSFLVFFGTNPGKVANYAPTLGLSLDDFGHVRGWCYLVQVPVYFLMGPLVDRFHPLRVGIVGMLLSSLTYFANFFFDHDKSSFTFWLILNFIAQAIYMGAYLAILPRLLPREKYGQFFSANQIFGFAGVSLSPVLCGLLMQTLRDYRYIFVWCGACTLAGFFTSCMLYRRWMALGGDEHYQPPGTTPGASGVN